MNHEWTPNEVNLLYQRIINTENELAKLIREQKSQIEFLGNDIKKAQLASDLVLQENKQIVDWLKLCDKAIKDLRAAQIQPKAEVKSKWFWK